MKKTLKISIFVDNPDAWIVPYARRLCNELSVTYACSLHFNADKIPNGDMLFLLGCTRLLPPKILKKNKHNLVVHESDLPKGKGWSPLSWQILEGKNKIPIVIFEADQAMDAGPIYLKGTIDLDGTELLPEIKKLQGEKTVDIVNQFLAKWPNIEGKKQVGEETYYPKRTRRDDEIDLRKTIIENFNHLRIVDNQKYPAWFKFKDQTYILKIYKYQGNIKLNHENGKNK